jgi:hypothetical protein
MGGRIFPLDFSGTIYYELAFYVFCINLKKELKEIKKVEFYRDKVQFNFYKPVKMCFDNDGISSFGSCDYHNPLFTNTNIRINEMHESGYYHLHILVSKFINQQKAYKFGMIYCSAYCRKN